MADQEEQTLTFDEMKARYLAAAKIANGALNSVLKRVKVGAKALDLCTAGDNYIKTAVREVFPEVEPAMKGVGFPTCINVNHVVGHYSPFPAEDKTVLAEGDVVKIDLGAQIDGFFGVVAHTVVVTATADAPVTGKKADAIIAARTIADAMIRMIRTGAHNNEITEKIQKIATAFGVNTVEGVLSHSLEQYIIDGPKVILLKPAREQKVEDYVFQDNDVFAIDIVVSTGQGKPRDSDARTTVYKRVLDSYKDLRLDAAAELITQIDSACPFSAFTLRNFEEKKARFGITEIIKQDLVVGYPVLAERAGEFVAQFKYTVVVTPMGAAPVTGLPVQAGITSDKKVADEEILAILAQPGLKAPENAAAAKKAAHAAKKAAAAAAAAAGAASSSS